MSPELAQKIEGFLARFDNSLKALLADTQNLNFTRGAPLAELAEAGAYAMGSGGKRIRPLLCLGAFEALGKNADTLPEHVFLALELIHTYSLVHDDLPAMDDDDLRRGRPSLHKAYDEATAILVGDGLQARAFELLADAPGLNAEQKICMVKVLAAAAGPGGMVGGQFIDIRATDSAMALAELQTMHTLKTGALIRAALAVGAIAANASAQQLTAIDTYGTHIGLAFQVVDDILDVEGDTATLGKTQGKDIAANKPTYVNLLGLEGARQEAQQLLQAALSALDQFGDAAGLLRDLAGYIVARDH